MLQAIYDIAKSYVCSIHNIQLQHIGIFTCTDKPQTSNSLGLPVLIKGEINDM